MLNPIGDDWWLQAYNRAEFQAFFRGMLPQNGEISFHAGGNYQDYLAYGLSSQENWGRWSEGKEAALSFSCPDLAQGFSQLSLVCCNLCKIEVCLNDTTLGAIEANGANDISLKPVGDLKLPLGALRPNGINLLRFRVSEPRPFQEGFGARQLGIAVSVVRFCNGNA
jgi:hypothetical protein